MKKLFLVMLSAFALVACHNNDIEPMSTQEVVTNNYNAVFVKTFGEPAANQDWGFGSRVLPTKTRVANTNGNQWGTSEGAGYLDYPHPNPITSDELDAVLAVFNQKGKETYTTDVDFRNFFVQQVYKGVAQYTAGNGETVTGSDKMNRLFCTTKYKQTKYWPVEFTEQANYEPDYVNNSNNGNITDWDGCTLMLMSSTLNWSYESSQGGSHTFYYWRMEKINGNYYVGFDFASVRQASANSNEQVDRDLIYNDWIIKIVPGKGEIPPTPPTPPVDRYTVRIICEDLNANGGSDFDFNDVVFDAEYVDGQDKTYVTVLCAGGTLPLFVAGREVHQLFADANPALNIGVTTMINTNATEGISGLEPVKFTIDEIVAPWDIKIAVMRDNNMIPLMANVGEPAAKIAVDPSFIWVDERVDIRTVYDNFADYVKDTTVNWY
jgi:hypothetical protein